MSNATLISIVPFPIEEFKPGIYPGFFRLEASKNNIPEVLVISDSVYHVEIDENRTITVKCPSEDIAKSVVDDYVTSNLAYSIDEDAAPGMFWKSGSLDLGTIMSKYSDDLKLANERQVRWFKKLVQIADDDWEKTRQHKFISDMQRYAAKALGLERPWIIVSDQDAGIIKCIACSSSISKDAIVCPQCKMILNAEKYKTLKFAEVK